MKKSFYLIFFICFLSFLNGQNEFVIHENGLIYNDKTMSNLKGVVDSLNLKFLVCENDRIFLSKKQTTAYKVTLKKGDILKAKKDMEQGIDFDKFEIKYPEAEISKSTLVVLFEYQNYDKKEIAELSEISLNDNYGLSIEVEHSVNSAYVFKGQWKFRYIEKSAYSEEYIHAFYFPHELKSIPLDPSYGKQIAYADCMIDTTASKLLDGAESGYFDLPVNWQDLSVERKKSLLDSLRSIRVVGSCSMDNSPRVHAAHIAILSAQTTDWKVFLKSHLDIMNDRFDRVSDGNYAWGQRQTYIKELEELDINVFDLLLGISFQIENPASNHYFGSIRRLGRAMVDSDDKALFEKHMLDMISDQNLDDYNRVVFYFLYMNYCNHHKDKMARNLKVNKLKKRLKLHADPLFSDVVLN